MTGRPVSLEGRTLRMARARTEASVGTAAGKGVRESCTRPPSADWAGTQPWVMRPDGEGAKTVEPGRKLAARAMTIDFGPARGRIPGSQTEGTPRGGAPSGGR